MAPRSNTVRSLTSLRAPVVDGSEWPDGLQVLDDSELWRSERRLIDYLSTSAVELAGKKVLEIGANTGAVSCVAGVLGATAVVTSADEHTGVISRHIDAKPI